jgi:DNA-binding LacI/PurR family transcriptional regulator
MERYISLLPGYEGKLAEEVFQIAYQATHLLLQSEKKLQAILYFTDQAALGGIKALLEMKLVPGKDIAVAGINDSNASKYGAYPFTSMQHNLETIADKLIENIDAVGPLKLYMSPVVHFRD